LRWHGLDSQLDVTSESRIVRHFAVLSARLHGVSSVHHAAVCLGSIVFTRLEESPQASSSWMTCTRRLSISRRSAAIRHVLHITARACERPQNPHRLLKPHVLFSIRQRQDIHLLREHRKPIPAFADSMLNELCQLLALPDLTNRTELPHYHRI